MSKEKKSYPQISFPFQYCFVSSVFSIVLFWAIFFLLSFFSDGLFACTNILVSKGASVDGSVSITYTADSAGFFPQLGIFPAKDYEPDAVIIVPANDHHPEIKIQQAPHTYHVVGSTWEPGSSHGDHFPRQGCINEFQLAIAETTFGGHEDLVNPKAALNYPMLITLALQRAKTAREAIKVIVDLVNEYGYNDEGESISIADKNEAWVFEIVGVGPREISKNNNAVWVAKRVPDGEISAHANQARIGEIPEKQDPNNCIYSQNIKSFAIEQKLFDPNSGKTFRFDEVYGNIDAKSKRVCESRVWSIFNRAAPSLKLSPDYHRGVENAAPYSWSIKPDKKLSTADIMALMRDNFEGTDFDMTKGIDAGAYGTPRRWRPLYWKVEGDKNEYSWERPISTQQTGFSIVTQSRSNLPDPVGGVLWYGVDDSYLTCYFPLYCSITKLPESYCVGSINKFDWESAWWVTNLVSNYANLKYSVITPDIIAVQKELETKFFELQIPVEKTAAEIFQTNPNLAKNYLTDYSVTQAESVAARWKKLATDIFTKHNDGYVRTKEGKYPNELAAYPEEWLKLVLKNKPNTFKLTDTKTKINRTFFEKPAKELLEITFKKQEQNNNQSDQNTKKLKDKFVTDTINNLKLKHIGIFFAEDNLIESFENKTYDSTKTKNTIKKYITTITKQNNTPNYINTIIEKFNKNELNEIELELSKRLLEVL